MLNNRLNWVLAGVLAALLAGIYLVWRWSHADAGLSNKTFSFIASNEQALAPKTGELPDQLNEPMPITPEELAPPQLLNFGEFTGVHEQRTAKGEVRLFRLGTGEQLLRLDNFSVVRGPGLHLYLTGKPGERRVEVVQEDFIDLGELRAISGSLNYLIPAEVDLTGYRGAVIFTPYFNEIYATAALTAAP